MITEFLNRKEKLVSFNHKYSSLSIGPNSFFICIFGQVRPELEEMRKKYEEMSKKYKEIITEVSDDTCNLVLLALCLFVCFCVQCLFLWLID